MSDASSSARAKDLLTVSGTARTSTYRRTCHVTRGVNTCRSTYQVPHGVIISRHVYSQHVIACPQVSPCMLSSHHAPTRHVSARVTTCVSTSTRVITYHHMPSRVTTCARTSTRTITCLHVSPCVVAFYRVSPRVTT